jgi:hypothetical protein
MILLVSASQLVGLLEYVYGTGEASWLLLLFTFSQALEK